MKAEDKLAKYRKWLNNLGHDMSVKSTRDCPRCQELECERKKTSQQQRTPSDQTR
jgi:hypothetical protein